MQIYYFAAHFRDPHSYHANLHMVMKISRKTSNPPNTWTEINCNLTKSQFTGAHFTQQCIEGKEINHFPWPEISFKYFDG